MKTFIFDLYNTLIDIHTDEHCERAWTPVVKFFAERGIKTDWKRLVAEYDAYWTEFNEIAAKSEFEYPECDCVAQFQSIAKHIGGDLSRDEATTALRTMRKNSIVRMRLFDGTSELLDELHRRGAKTYLLSNAQASFTWDELAEVGLKDKFDGALLSSEHGCRKPDRAYFKILFDRFGLKKADSVMIGDDVTSDGKGAADFGIKFVLANGGAAAHADEILKLAER